MTLRTVNDWIAQSNSSTQLAAALAQEFGRVDGAIVSAAADVIPKISFTRPSYIKRFSDLRNVTITPSAGMTATAIIDQNSPFGGPALKLTLTADSGGTRNCEVIVSNLNYDNFDDHLAASIWVDDATKVSQIIHYMGTSGFALYQQKNRNVFGGGSLVGGHTLSWCGPLASSPTVNTFTFGTDALQTYKVRFTVPASQTAVVWVRDFVILARQRPLVCFTWDDGLSSWATRMTPYLDAAGLQATFALNSASIDAGSGITTAQIAALVAAGHQVTSHNVNNYKLQTVYAQGDGENNGTSTSEDALTYAGSYVTARNVLAGTHNVPEDDFTYHSWVQGGYDQAGIEYLRAEGVELARSVISETQPYGHELGSSAMALSQITLGSGTTLAAAKAAIDSARTYGTMVVFMGHVIADTAADSITWAESDWAALVAYVKEGEDNDNLDCLAAKEILTRFRAAGLLRASDYTPKTPVRCIGVKLAANFNITADQAVTLAAGSYVITGVIVAKASISLTTAAGGVYTSAAKGGTAIVAAGQTYTALTGATTDIQICTMAATPTVSGTTTGAIAGGTVYLSLTTGQGAAATADVFVFGYPA